MMGFFFAVSCIIGIVLCCFGGSGSTALDCLLAGADSAVELSISLAGAYLLWMGLINVASEAGLIEKLAARMHKPLRLLMPDAGDAGEVGNGALRLRDAEPCGEFFRTRQRRNTFRT